MAITVIAALIFWQASQYAVAKNNEYKQALKTQQAAKKLNTNYQRIIEQYQDFEALNKQRFNVSNDIAQAGYQPSKWIMRDLKVQGAAIPREEIPAYLVGASNQAGYLFIPHRFELRVPYAEDDIFSWVTGDSKTLNLSLKGQYYIRREQ